MSKSSPITNRIQKALYMKSSALKDAEDEQESKVMKSIVKDSSTGSVKDATTTTETVQLPDVVEGINERVEGSFKAKEDGSNVYKGDYYAPDSPLGKEMAKLGLDNSPDAIRDYEKSKLIENKQRRLSGEIKDDGAFGDITGTDDEGNTRTLSDEETLGLTAEQIGDRKSQSQTITPGGTEEIVKTVTEEKPQDFAVHSQLSAGQAARGNQKAINKAMRTERKLGAFDGPKPKGKGYSDKDRWTKKDKRLYAAKLAAGEDMGYGTGIGIGGQSYEKNKMVYQKNVGEDETNTFTKIDDPKHNSKNIDIEDSKKISMKESAAAKMLGRTPLSMQDSPFKQGKKKAAKLFTETFVDIVKKNKASKNLPVKVEAPKIKKQKTQDIGFEEGGIKYGPDGKPLKGTEIVPTGPAKGGGGQAHVDAGNLKPKKNLLQKGWDKVKQAGKSPAARYGAAAVVGGGLTYAFTGGGDDEPVKEEGGEGGGGTKTVEDTKKTETTVTTPPKKTNKFDNMGLGEIDGGTKVATGRGSKPNKDIVTVGTSLSETLSKTQQRQKDKEARRAGRQARKDANLAARQKRRDSRRQNPTIVGAGLRKAAGKVFDSSVNNMGNQSSASAPQNYNQKDKKKKGQFGSISRPGYNV